MSSPAAPAVVLVADELRHLHAGTEGQMLALYRGLVAAGWRVELVVFRGAAGIREAWPGEVHELGIRRLASPGAWWRAWRFARQRRREGFALAHVFFNDAAILMPPLLKLAGLRVVVARRDMGFWYTPGQLRALRRVRPFVDRVVANSRAVAANVAAAEGYDAQDITVIYNGVAPRDAEEAPPAEGGSAEPLRIGLVANIRPVKRIQDAVAAFALVARQHPGAVLEIVGDGDPEALRSQAEGLGISGRVRFTGRVSDVRSRLQRYAACILTSESEGLSNAVIEYMLAGRPVVCTDAGGNPELVVHGATGFLYPVGDIRALAGYIDRLLSDAALREPLGRDGRARAETLCAPEAMWRAHDGLYRELLGGRTVLRAAAGTPEEGPWG